MRRLMGDALRDEPAMMFYIYPLRCLILNLRL
jgi:hypothetical protein